MEKVVIVRYSEIHLKGKNRGYFERMFYTNMERALKDIQHEIRKCSGRYLVENFIDEDEVVDALKRVFGTHSLSVAIRVESDFEKIVSAAKEVSKTEGRFRITAHRADKKFQYNSIELSAQLGGRLMEEYPDLEVDLHTPEFTVFVDVREEGYSLVYSEVIKGAGGMPVGTAGKGMLLISGGIDSPVAGYMMAKRGMRLDGIHFHSYPYTSPAAREKVEELTRLVTRYAGSIDLAIVSVTHIQEEIHKRCAPELMVTMLRRFMMRIAERLAKKTGAQCLITGESLGQVASQTIEGMTSSNSVVETLPVLRPLVGFDKDEIITIAEKIGTFRTSILPYEDCCTVFLPDHPAIKPKMERILAEEAKLDVEGLIQEAFDSLERVTF